MQTFVPYPEIINSVRCLDWQRLGKQRVECKQILNALSPNYTKKGWINHPAVKMWRGHENELRAYANACITEWISRGYKNTMQLYEVKAPLSMPSWWGGKIHTTHRSNLLRKNEVWYSQFGWQEPKSLEYFWPISMEVINEVH